MWPPHRRLFMAYPLDGPNRQQRTFDVASGYNYDSILLKIDIKCKVSPKSLTLCQRAGEVLGEQTREVKTGD